MVGLLEKILNKKILLASMKIENIYDSETCTKSRIRIFLRINTVSLSLDGFLLVITYHWTR
jgi:hypothetical protein